MSNGKFRFRIPLDAQTRKRLRTTDFYYSNGVETVWYTLLTRKVLELLKHPRMGENNVREVCGPNTAVQMGVFHTYTEETWAARLRSNGLKFIHSGRTGNGNHIEITFDFDKPYSHDGCADGNSSRETLLRACAPVAQGGFDLLGKIERGEIMAPELELHFFSGLTAEQEIELGIMRNEQVGVTDSTSINHEGGYDLIKDNLHDTINAKIAYKQNEDGYKVENVVQEIVAFDFHEWPDGDTNPLPTYSSRISPRRHYQKNEATMTMLAPIFEGIITLHEVIQRDFMTYSKPGRGKAASRFWEVTGIEKEQGTFNFIAGERKYYVPRSLTIPILAAFRQCVVDNDGKAEWVFGDYDGLLAFWETVAPVLVKRVYTYVDDEGNANAAAKKNTLWSALYEDIDRAMGKAFRKLSA